MQNYPKKIKFFIAMSRFYTSLLSLLSRFGRAVIGGVCLGIASDEEIYHATEYFYSEMDRRYQDTTWCLERGLFDWERDVIRKYFKGLKNLMVLNAGAGREVLALNQMSYKIDAFEPNQTLLEKGNEILAKEVKIKPVPPSDFPEVDQAYDGVLVGWGSYMHMPGRETRIRMLQKMHHKIVKGGPVLLSFFTHSRDSKMHKLSYGIARFMGAITLRKRRVEPGDFLGKFYYHSFTEDEIAQELQAAGFKLVSFEKKPYGHAVAQAV